MIAMGTTLSIVGSLWVQEHLGMSGEAVGLFEVKKVRTCTCNLWLLRNHCMIRRIFKK